MYVSLSVSWGVWERTDEINYSSSWHWLFAHIILSWVEFISLVFCFSSPEKGQQLSDKKGKMQAKVDIFFVSVFHAIPCLFRCVVDSSILIFFYCCGFSEEHSTSQSTTCKEAEASRSRRECQ